MERGGHSLGNQLHLYSLQAAFPDRHRFSPVFHRANKIGIQVGAGLYILPSKRLILPWVEILQDEMARIVCGDDLIVLWLVAFRRLLGNENNRYSGCWLLLIILDQTCNLACIWT